MLPDSMNVGVIAENIKKLEVMVKEAGSELPTPGVGDIGKILKVGSDGYELATEYSYTPPAYSSASEVNTGRKWIDGKDIYSKVIVGSFPEITTTGNQYIDTNVSFESPVHMEIFAHRGGFYTEMSNYIVNWYENNGSIVLSSVTTTYSEIPYIVVLEYTKP